MMQRWILLALLAACAAPMTEAPDDGGCCRADAPFPVDTGRFQRCTEHAFQPAHDESWRHTRSGIVAAASANHSAGDVVARTDATPFVGAKLTYGSYSKDLEDEDVLAFLDTCQGWRLLGRGTTDDDGRVKVRLPALPVGVYEVRFQVAGDQSTTSAYAWFLPAGTRLVVTDIDATLTTSDLELVGEILTGDPPGMYPDADTLLRAHADRGHIVYYLTGRPYWRTEETRAWLDDRAFPAGVVRVSDSNSSSLPTESSVGAYKRAKLDELVAAGFVIDLAYGNATTDISAYLGAGISHDRIWIIGDHAGEQGTNAVTTGAWTARAADVLAQPPIMQPFAY